MDGWEDRRDQTSIGFLSASPSSYYEDVQWSLQYPDKGVQPL
jgi:hypothetical protein